MVLLETIRSGCNCKILQALFTLGQVIAKSYVSMHKDVSRAEWNDNIALSNSKHKCQNILLFFQKQTQDNLKGKCSSLSKVTLKLLILCMH